MNSYKNNIQVLITSTHADAEGGIAALHRVLFERPLEKNFRVVIFPVSSSKYRFEERIISRVVRLFQRIKHRIY